VHKLIATILKDIRVLARDKVGLSFMFGLPVLLVLIVTGIQNNTFELADKNRVPILLCNRDTGDLGGEFANAIGKTGLLEPIALPANLSGLQIRSRVQKKDALLGLVIPEDFSARIKARARTVAGKVMTSFGLADSAAPAGSTGSTGRPDAGDTDTLPISLYYHPILQESFRSSAKGALYGALQLVESRQILRTLYLSLNEKKLPDSLEQELLSNRTVIEELPVPKDGSRTPPNATQHNIPAWTIFAMFFVVISLGSGIVREKLNGSFIRLRTLPTSYFVAILSKQVTYLAVTLVQAAVIFALGAWLFPLIGLPPLNFHGDWPALILVTLLCGWCAVSYAICIGVLARTEEQANGFGAVSIVILAAIGGLMVPGFLMPGSFRTAMQISPLHWCLDAYYGVFLEGGGIAAIWSNILPLFLMIIGLQVLSFWMLKRKNLI
jgi:ABC-2 type transport system permease protein